MKAIEITAFGLEKLQLVERPTPAPGPGQLLIRIEAVSLNYLDLMVVRGHYNPQLALPHVPGADGAGTVQAVGTGVTDWQPGDRVTTHFMQNWLDGPPTAHSADAKLGATLPGVLAEYVVLPASGVVRTPAHMSSAEAATLPVAGLTAWVGLVEYGHLRPGQTVLTQGTGGVSIAALQLAKAAGARVIATTGSADKAGQLRALGADEVINYRTTPDWPAQVKALTGGEGVDLTLNTVGGESINQSLQAIRPGGLVGLVGVIEGVEATFNMSQAFSSFATLKAYQVGSRRRFEDYGRALESSGIRPVVDRTFPLAEAQAAFRYLEEGAHVGKVVITL